MPENIKLQLHIPLPSEARVFLWAHNKSRMYACDNNIARARAMAALVAPFAALISASGYLIHAPKDFFVNLCFGRPIVAIQTTALDIFYASECVLLAIVTIAWAVLGDPKQSLMFDALRNANAAQLQQIRSLQEEKIRTDSTLENVRKTLADREVAIETLTDNLRSAQTDLAAQREQVGRLNARIQGAEEQRKKFAEDLRTGRAEVKAQLAKKDVEIERYQRLHKQVGDKVISKVREIEKLESSLLQAEEEIKRYRDGMLASLDRKLPKLEQSVSSKPPSTTLPVFVAHKEEQLEFKDFEFVRQEFVSNRSSWSLKRLPTQVYQVIADCGTMLWGTAKRWFVDGGAEWKEQRYAVALAHLAPAVDKLHATAKAETIHKNVAKDIRQLIEEMQNLTTQLVASPRIAYHDLLSKYRAIVIALMKKKDYGVSPKLEAEIYAFAENWYTSMNMATFQRELVWSVAKAGQPELDPHLKGVSLSEKVSRISAAIEKAPEDVKAPVANLKAAKLLALFNNFDPHAHTNMPTQLAKVTYKNQQGQEREVIHLRTGVPVCQSYKNSNEQSENWLHWDNGKIAFAPEYIAFLRAAKLQNKKVLSILHLNPEWINKSEHELETLYNIHKANPANLLPIQEAIWLKLYLQLNQLGEFTDVVDIAFFPLDAEWMKELVKPAIVPAQNFIDWLSGVMKLRESGFRLQGRENPAPLIEHVMQEVKECYFNEVEQFCQQEKLAFLSRFYSRMSEYLQIIRKASYVVRNCKDAVDRTMALVGDEYAELLDRLGRLADPKEVELLLACINGPALAVVKRAILDSRKPTLLAGLDHHERQKQANRLVTPPPIEGWVLADIDLGGREVQSLHPAPATKKTDAAYRESLAYFRDNPDALPRHLDYRIDSVALEKCLAALYKSDIDLMPHEAVAVMDEPLKSLQKLFNHSILGIEVAKLPYQWACTSANDQYEITARFDLKNQEGNLYSTDSCVVNLQVSNRRLRYGITVEQRPSRPPSPVSPSHNA